MNLDRTLTTFVLIATPLAAFFLLLAEFGAGAS